MGDDSWKWMAGAALSAGALAAGGSAAFLGLAFGLAGGGQIPDPTATIEQNLNPTCWECEGNPDFESLFTSEAAAACGPRPEVLATCVQTAPRKSSGMTIAGEGTDAEVAFLGSVEGILYENVEVLEWLECNMNLYTGAACAYRDKDYDFEGCFAGQISSGDLEFMMAAMPSSECKGTMSANYKGKPHTVRICRTDRWKRWVKAYGDDGLTDVERQCAAVQAAASVVHEFVHLCGGIDHGPDCCGITAFPRNSFLWAMAKRYPCLTDAGCCAFMADDALWMYGEKVGECGRTFKNDVRAGACERPQKRVKERRGRP